MIWGFRLNIYKLINVIGAARASITLTPQWLVMRKQIDYNYECKFNMPAIPDHVLNTWSG